MFRRKTAKTKRKKKVYFRPETLVLIKQGFYGATVFLLVIFTIWGVWHLTRLPAVTITNIEVTGGHSISHEEVRTVASEAMSGEYLKLIPRTFAFLYPKQDILNSVSQIDKLKQASIERTTLDSVSITITEYIPHAMWCEGRETGTCYFIDELGMAFSKAPLLTGTAFLRYRTLGREPQLMEVLTDGEQLQLILTLVEMLEANFGFLVLNVELDVVGDVFLVLRGGSEIKVSKRLTAEETIRNLEAVLSADEFRELRPGDFPYIDLRFGNKVFVSDEWPVETAVAEEIEMIEIDIAEVIQVSESDLNSDTILDEEVVVESSSAELSSDVSNSDIDEETDTEDIDSDI